MGGGENKTWIKLREQGPGSLPSRLVANRPHFLGDQGGGRRKTNTLCCLPLVGREPGLGHGEETRLEQKLGSKKGRGQQKLCLREKYLSAERIGPAEGKAVWAAYRPGDTVSPRPPQHSKVPSLPGWSQATRGPAAPPRPRPAVSLTTVTSTPGRGRRVRASCYATAG